MMKQTELDIRSVLRYRVRDERRKRGWSQEALNHRMRQLGFLDWSRQTVASIEADPPTRRVLISELVGLASLFHLPVSALIMEPEAQNLRLEGGAVVARRTLHEALTGQIPTWRQAIALDPENEQAEGDGPSEDEIWSAMLDAKSDAKGELERYAAAKLGVVPSEVVATGYKLWGRSITAERDSRAKELGHPKEISRKLVQELRDTGLGQGDHRKEAGNGNS